MCLCLSNNYDTRFPQRKSHITEIAHEANSRLSFLRRYIGGCPYRLQEVGYISLVRSCLEYSGATWDMTIKDESDRLEVIQRRAARGAISVTALLNDFKLQPLVDWRRNQRLSIPSKILHHVLKIPPHSVNPTISSSRTRKNIFWFSNVNTAVTSTPPTGRAPSAGSAPPPLYRRRTSLTIRVLPPQGKPVPAIICIISYYIGPRYNGTRP